jgi:hypothetical protein
MSCEIIQFLAFAEAAAEAKVAHGQTREGAGARLRAWRRAKREKQAAVLATAPETLSTTCRNKYLRDALKGPWRKADAIREYWCRRLDMESAISSAQYLGLPEGSHHPKCSPEQRLEMVGEFRRALAIQMKTRSPDMGAVNWKKAQLSDYTFRHPNVQRECKQIIATDTKWLFAHPTRSDQPGKKGKKA